MRIAVTGSIATDHLMTFPGRFTEQLVGDRLSSVSLSFLVDELSVHRGGVAANIALGLARLGHSPFLIGAVGPDFAEYRSYLDAAGVDTRFVHISDTLFTARFVCTTDLDHNQIASFYPGAMSEARNIRLSALAEEAGGLDLVVVSPNDPAAMLEHTAECVRSGFPFLSDPSQQLARIDGEQIRSLVDGATYLFTNEYEHALLVQKTGWDDDAVLSRVGSWVTTYGAAGVRIQRRGRPEVAVPALPAKKLVDPTGVGDGFRAGFLSGLSRGLGEEQSGRLGCALATLVLEAPGPQDYRVEPAALHERIAAAYGARAAQEIAASIAAKVSAR
jgi:adenosine kinase